MLTTLAIIYGTGFLFSLGIGNKVEDGLKWPKTVYDNLSENKKEIEVNEYY